MSRAFVKESDDDLTAAGCGGLAIAGRGDRERDRRGEGTSVDSQNTGHENSTNPDEPAAAHGPLASFRASWLAASAAAA